MTSIFFILYIIVLYFNIIHNQNCENIVAESRSDCFTVSSPNKYCCFISIGKNCTSVPKEELNQNYFDCGVTGDNYGKYDFQQYHQQNVNDQGFQICGRKTPSNAEDCLEYSDIGNNCCYFDYKNGTKACFYIGREVDKDNKEKSFPNLYFNCFSLNLMLNLYWIILIQFLL